MKRLIEKKEIEQDKEPTRGTLWLKGRVNKDEEYQDDEIRSVGDKLKETEDKIKEGTLQVDQGTDAMTLVLVVDERILLLESQLDAAIHEREEKELLIKSMSSKMSQTEGIVTKLKNQLAAQWGQLQSTLTQLTPLDVSPVEIHPINSSADEEGGTTVVGCDQNDASIRKEMQKRETVKSVGAKKTTRSIRKDSSSQDSQSKENVSVLPQATESSFMDPKATPPTYHTYRDHLDADFPDHVYRLKNALYGLKQAPRAWGDILLVQVYVDDIIFGSTNPDFSKRFANLMKNNFEMSMIGELKFFLGLQVHQSPRGIFISQSQYAIELLKKHGMDDCVSMNTPMATERLDADLYGTPTDQTTYLRMIGQLMYLTAS
ncbi:retrovirus-related pol polyprotein from transposon TNT 1-94 [Tanacetum coccineum]|uniref:Retrovirus-related pol polyprotein from transposon TNT 1-94 n=1 Tax=Tanacetum coccineum TaxID=301880 RepID=A0ABQ5DRV9_9ASTR